MTFIQRSCEANYCNIHIVGDITKCRDIVREFCNTYDLSVMITPSEYIYPNDSESGAIVGLFNNPKYPIERDALYGMVKILAKKLIIEMEQDICMIATPDTTMHLIHPDKKMS